MIWGMVKKILDQRTVDKINILSGDNVQPVIDAVGAANVPTPPSFWPAGRIWGESALAMARPRELELHQRIPLDKDTTAATSATISLSLIHI